MSLPSFGFATAAQVLFGVGRSAELPGILEGLGARALVCTGASPRRHAALLDGLGLAAVTFPVPREPTVAMAREATATARDHGAELVVAVGGGSVVDLGKAVAMLLANGGDPMDYLEVVGRGPAITRPSVPFVGVPTTAGTGAEVTANAVLESTDHRRKASLRSPFMLPAVALVDPELTVGCPPAVTAASGLDALTQCLEPFVSPAASPVTDAFAREGLRRAALGLAATHRDGADLAARTDMALCSLFGGLCLANARLGAVHGLAGPVGGTVPAAPHGAVCAALLAPVMTANLRTLRQDRPSHPALGRYDEVARLLTGRTEAVAEDGVAWVRATVATLGVPGLARYGLGLGQLAAVAAAAAGSSGVRGNPVALTGDELTAVLTEAL